MHFEINWIRDLNKNIERIREKEKNRKEVKDQIEIELFSLTYKGLYVVVLKDVNPLALKKELADKAERLLTPKAIEDLNRIFVSSMNTAINYQLFWEKIKSRVSGEMDVEKQYLSG